MASRRFSFRSLLFGASALACAYGAPAGLGLDAAEAGPRGGQGLATTASKCLNCGTPSTGGRDSGGSSWGGEFMIRATFEFGSVSRVLCDPLPPVSSAQLGTTYAPAFALPDIRFDNPDMRGFERTMRAWLKTQRETQAILDRALAKPAEPDPFAPVVQLTFRGTNSAELFATPNLRIATTFNDLRGTIAPDIHRFVPDRSAPAKRARPAAKKRAAAAVVAPPLRTTWAQSTVVEPCAANCIVETRREIRFKGFSFAGGLGQ